MNKYELTELMLRKQQIMSHTPSVCLDCRNGTHNTEFLDKLNAIKEG